MDKKTIKKLHNAYFRMDDALDALQAQNSTGVITPELEEAWKAHKLLSDFIGDVDPDWNAPPIPDPTFNVD